MSKPLILVVNDDGISASGIRNLIKIMNDFGDVVVVAQQRSDLWTARNDFRTCSLTRPVRSHNSAGALKQVIRHNVCWFHESSLTYIMNRSENNTAHPNYRS